MVFWAKNICLEKEKYKYFSYEIWSFSYMFWHSSSSKKGKNSLNMVQNILDSKRAVVEILKFVIRILIHVIRLVKQLLHPGFFFLSLTYDHTNELFRELRYDMLRFTHCGKFRAKHCLYSNHWVYNHIINR